jgi:hypothetical protein
MLAIYERHIISRVQIDSCFKFDFGHPNETEILAVFLVLPSHLFLKTIFQSSVCRGGTFSYYLPIW